MSERSELFQPINLLELPSNGSFAYVKKLRKAQSHDATGGQAQYRGSADLLRLVQDHALWVGAIMRFWQTDLPEWMVVTDLGLVPREFDGNPELIIPPPFERLDHDLSGEPYRWNIEDYELFPNQEIDNLVSDFNRRV